MEVGPGVLVAVSGAAFLIGFTKAGLGGGLGPVITAVMVLAMPIQTALGLQLPMLIVGDVFSIAALWRKWDLRLSGLLLGGSLFGVVGGTFVLASVTPETIRSLLGVVSLSFVLYRLVEPWLLSGRTLTPHPAYGLLAGAAGAVGSTVAHSGGPAVGIYLLLQRVPPVTYAATHVLVFAVINLLKIPTYTATGLFDLRLQLRLAPALVFLPAGVVFGRWLVGRVDPTLFGRVILALLAATGTYLLVT